MTKTIGVGVVGIGAIGKLHAENYVSKVPGARLAGIADVNLPAANELASRLGVSAVYADYHQLLNDPSVDAIVVATPPFLKKDITLAAADRHKHVFCEKPMTLSLKEADEMISAVRRSGIAFQVGYQKRSDVSFMRAKSEIAEGRVGKILLIRAHNRDPPTTVAGWSADPKRSGSVFLDTCSHDFDALRYLSGSEVTRVSADGNAMMYEELRKNGDYDTVVVNLRLASGAMAQVDACGYTPYGFDSGSEVVGTGGGIIIGMGEKTFTHLYGKEGMSNERHDYWGSRWAQAYRDEMAAFVSCINEGGVPRATIQDGRAAMEIGLAAWNSVKSGAPVGLPLS
ncbi:MAG: Gfo/Idh/MocA family oxidoreductase [Nitrososphaerota archaeon]|nr:Gfo/Idh/MocA family oxidoreductase [Nitrososphaerota archaeon]